jgi:class 3 adenylate cyclase
MDKISNILDPALGYILQDQNINYRRKINPYNSYGMMQPPSYLYDVDDERTKKLEKEISEKEEKLKNLFNELNNKKLENKELNSKLEEIKISGIELKKRQELKYLTSRIHQSAVDLLFVENNVLLKRFNEDKEIETAVMSIDIRRSTDLMLKASNHDEYANFISGLTEQLKGIVIKNYGVFDKFTGDGILAYFPIFYTGENAIKNCCITAKECHMLFSDYYKENRKCFDVVIKTGLGIGIDFGLVKLVRINNELTMLGNPVVYACRLASAPANHTYLNQNAITEIKKKNFDIEIKFNETEIDLKNEGTAIVYDFVNVNNCEIKIPQW